MDARPVAEVNEVELKQLGLQRTWDIALSAHTSNVLKKENGDKDRVDKERSSFPCVASQIQKKAVIKLNLKKGEQGPFSADGCTSVKLRGVTFRYVYQMSWTSLSLLAEVAVSKLVSSITSPIHVHIVVDKLVDGTTSILWDLVDWQ